VEFAHQLGVLTWLGVAAAITIVYGSLMALTQDSLKKRLAYSTVSQVSYIALGAAILGPIATVGGVVHLVHQGLMKITLFFAAGNYAETLGIHRVSEMDGVGRRMPGTTLAFTAGALGMIGIPPVAGFVSKYYLGLGAAEAGVAHWVLPVLAVSSLLNAAYFLPILYRAWFKVPARDWPAEHIPAGRLETRATLLWPPAVTALLAVAAGLFAAAPASPLAWAELIARREYGL
jgi:multicomponent Na+:H+ antiporter subunit D